MTSITLVVMVPKQFISLDVLRYAFELAKKLAPSVPEKLASLVVESLIE